MKDGNDGNGSRDASVLEEVSRILARGGVARA